LTTEPTDATATPPGAPPPAGARARVWSQPLRFHLGVVIVALLVAVAMPLVWIGFREGHAAALATAQREMRLLADRVGDELDDLVSSSLGFVTMAAVSEQMLSPPAADLDAKTALILEVLDAAPAIDSLYVGRGDGGFVQGVRLDDDGKWQAAIGAPADAVRAIRVIVPGTGDAPQESWRFLDAAGRTIGEAPAKDSRYDPRRRPWYRAALAAAPGPAMSGPYAMATTGSIGLSISETGAAGSGVVVAADVLLDTIGRFLAEEKVSPNAEAFVFDRTGRLLAHSRDEVAGALSAAVASRAGAAELGRLPGAGLVAAAREILDGLDRGEDGNRTVEHDGAPWLMHLVRLKIASLADGAAVVVAAPQSDFTADAEALLRNGVLIAAGVLLLGICAAVLISIWISRSLDALTGQARRFEALDLAEPRPIRSRISEVTELAGAMAAARKAVTTFALYVPKEVVRMIVGGGGGLDTRSAVRREVTVMFTDIRDFTTICETAEPEAVVAMLSAYFDAISAAVHDHDGAIIQFLGDSVYAMWNAPIADPAHVDDACRCALAIGRAVAAFNERQAAKGEPALVTRIGVHTGPAVVGSMGAADRLQYTAMGDTVNVASRLEGINKTFGTLIIASRAVRDRCTAPVTFRPLGAVQAKGRAEALEVFELLPPQS